MSSVPEHPTWLARFCDAFFQERNIQWLLGIGMLILLGSSTMLVVQHWETTPPVWKSTVLFTYTLAFYFVGDFGSRRLGLIKTGTCLLALTVLLIPVDFLAIRWVHPEGLLSSSGLTAALVKIPLWGFFGAVSAVVSARIFKTFLRTSNVLFLASYLVLAFSGALLSLVPAPLLPVAALLLWGVYAAGVMDVSRHIFWLTEEHRLPRIFGFFPTLLLGSQFLLLFWSTLAGQVPLHWMGLGLILMSLPVLKSVDDLARIIERRTGLLARLPVAVAVPLVVSILAILSGVVLSGIGFPETQAIVLTAALAAVAMGLIARRTRSSLLVWLTLLLIATAYQTSPVFFKEMARSVAQSGAQMIQEDRLPLAFYGLTYLPLLIGLTACLRWTSLRQAAYCAVPIRQVVTIVPALLLAASCTHWKASFSVGLALAGLAFWQMVLFRDRRFLPGCVGGIVAAGWGAVPFAGALGWHTVTLPSMLLSWLVTAALLLIPGRWLDRWSTQWESSENHFARSPFCQWTSLAITLLCVPVWVGLEIGVVGVIPNPDLITGCAIGLLLIAHSFLWKQTVLSALTLLVSLIFGGIIADKLGWSSEQILLAETLALGLISLFGRVIERFDWKTLNQVFGQACLIISAVGTVFFQVLLLPSLVGLVLGMDVELSGVARVILLVMTIDLAWRQNSSCLTVLGWFSTLGLIGAFWMQFSSVSGPLFWLTTLWGGLSGVMVPLVRSTLLKDRARRALEFCLWSTLLPIVLIGLEFMSLQNQLASAMALAGLIGLVVRRDSDVAINAVCLLANLSLLVGALSYLLGDNGVRLSQVTFSQITPWALPLGYLSALSVLFWESRSHKQPDVALEVIFGLWGVCGTALVCDLVWNGTDNGWSSLLFTLGIAFELAVQQIWRAAWHFQRKNAGPEQPLISPEMRVWIAQGVLALGVLCVMVKQSLPLGSSALLFAPLMAGLLAWGLSRLAAMTTAWRFAERPLSQSARILPVATVLLGLVRHVLIAPPEWLGVNSLALLLVAGYYFISGLEERKPAFLVGSAIVLNLAFAFLWNELRWSDPQFFLIPIGLSVLTLVELLEQKLPVSFLTPLRYVGALIILVSPTFEIAVGSWLHLATLLLASVLVILLAMGLRIRALMFTGTAFLIADLVAMVVRGSLDDPQLLWVIGIALGVSVIGFAAYCEQHREQLLQRIRFISARLETWK